MKRLCLITASLALLAGCHGEPTDASSAAHTPTPHVFTAPPLGLSIAIPADMTLRRDFDRSYLDAAAWQAFAGGKGQGHPLAALVLKGSDRITAAELRISESGDADALAHWRTARTRRPAPNPDRSPARRSAACPSSAFAPATRR